MTDLSKLSTGAILTLSALLDSSACNGHDFGFMDEALDAIKAHGMGRHQFAGYVAHLTKVGAIDWSEDLSEDSGVACDAVQFALTEFTVDLEDSIHALAKGHADWKAADAPQGDTGDATPAPFNAATAIVLTAKTPVGNVWTDCYRSAPEAIQAGIDLRKAGTVNWRTIRYSIAGESVTTAALRKMVCHGDHGVNEPCAKCG